MKYNLVFTKTAVKDIEKLDTITKKHIQKKFEYFINLPSPLSVAKKLNNFEIGEYRWRVGDYRVIFDLEKEKSVNSVIVLRVSHRKEVYKK